MKRKLSRSKKQTIIGTVIMVMIVALMVTGGVFDMIINHEYSFLGLIAFYAVILAMAYIAGRSNRKYIKLMTSLPSDRKLISTHVTAIDVGNFRFTYHIYEKGGTFNPINKVFISMAVPVPFKINDYETQIAITKDLADIIRDLKDEGVLADSSNPGDEEINEAGLIGQMFFVEVPLKEVTSDRLVALQGKVVDIINKYELNEYRYCTISGTNEGTTYQLYKGNLLCSTVFMNAFDGFSYRYSYNDIRSIFYTEYESSYGVEEFNKIYDAAMDLKSDISSDDLEKTIKVMFKQSGVKTVVKLTNHDNGISVSITIPSKASTSEYHLTYESDRWWIHANGRLDNINPLSIEDESTACNMFMRIIGKYAAHSL